MKFSDLSSKNKHPVSEDWQDVKDFGKEVGSGVVDVGRGFADLAKSAAKDFVDPESYKRDWETGKEVLKRGAKFAKDDPVGAAKYAARTADDAARAMANTATFGGADYAEALGRKYVYGDSKHDKRVWDKYQAQQQEKHGTKPEPWTGSLDQYKKVQDIWSSEAEERSPSATAAGDVGGALLSVPFTGGARAGLSLAAKGTQQLAKVPKAGKILKPTADIGAATVGGVAAEKGTGRIVRKVDPDNPYIGEPYQSPEQAPLPEARAPRRVAPTPHTTPRGVTVDLNTKPPSFKGSGRKWKEMSDLDKQAAWDAEHAATTPAGGTPPASTTTPPAGADKGAFDKAVELANKWREFKYGTRNPAEIADIKAKQPPGVFKQALAKHPWTTGVGGTLAAGTLGSGLYNWKKDPTNQSIPFHVTQAATDIPRGLWSGLGKPGEDVGTAIGQWIDKKLGKNTGNTTTGGTTTNGGNTGGGNQTDVDDDGLGGRNLRPTPEVGEVPTVSPNASPQRNEEIQNEEKQSLDFDKLRANPNVRIMLDLISKAEGNTDYDTLVGGGKFKDFSTHPKTTVRLGKKLRSDAAGRYQIMGFNWGPYSKKLGLTDFSPASQDKIAIQMLADRGALDAVLKGDFHKAVEKSGSQWTSLPATEIRQGIGPRSWKWVDSNVANLKKAYGIGNTVDSTKVAQTDTTPKVEKPGYYALGDSQARGVAGYGGNQWDKSMAYNGASILDPNQFKKHLANIEKIPKGSVVAISGGGNDVASAKPEVIAAQMNKLIAAAKARGLQVVHLLPTATDNPKTKEMRDKLRDAMTQNQTLAPIVDLGFASKKDPMNLHLDKKGYKTIAKNITDMLPIGGAVASELPPSKVASKSDVPNLTPQKVKPDSDLSKPAAGVKSTTVPTKNVADKTDKTSKLSPFEKEFAAARSRGDTTFPFTDKSGKTGTFSTRLAGEPETKVTTKIKPEKTSTVTPLSGKDLDSAKYGSSFKGKAYDPDLKIDFDNIMQRSYGTQTKEPPKSPEIKLQPEKTVDIPHKFDDDEKSTYDKGIETLTGKERMTDKKLNTVQVPESINTELQDILRLAGKK